MPNIPDWNLVEANRKFEEEYPDFRRNKVYKNSLELAKSIDLNDKTKLKDAPRGLIRNADGSLSPKEYSDDEMKNYYETVLNHLKSGKQIDDEFLDSNPDIPSDAILSAYNTFKGR